MFTWRLYAPSPLGQIHLRAACGAAPAARQPGAVMRRPLVCLHGTPLSGLEFELLQHELAVDRLVVCPDTPGFGGSERPVAMPDLAQYASALGDALEHSGLLERTAQIDVLGYHTGAALASELARARPALVARVVLAGIPLLTANQRSDMTERYLKPSPIFTDPEYVANEFRTAVFGRPSGTAERRLALFAERLRAGTVAWWAARAVFAYDLESTLRQLQQPVALLLLQDMLAVNSRAAATLLRNGTVIDLEARTSELPFDDQTVLIAANLREFLDA